MSTGSASPQARCPVAPDQTGAWVLRRHEDVVSAARDPEVFSSQVSRHLNIPNGMDGERHARYRSLVERYMSPERVADLEAGCRRIASELVESLPLDRPVDAVSEIGAPFAVRAQSAWLGWPAELEIPLLEWMEENRAAARSGDYEASAAVAEKFNRIIRALIISRRRQTGAGGGDLTGQLIAERIEGRSLTDDEIVSILRNWTAGDLGTIAACVGVVIHRLAKDPWLQNRWRHACLEKSELDREIDELLRIDDPFTASRRVTTRPVEIDGQVIPAGARVRLAWSEANRDPEEFDDPEDFRPVENASRNLVYGTGPHVCPGRGLATMEIRVAVEELLAGSGCLVPDPDSSPVRATPPQGGFRSVPVQLQALP